MKFLILVSFVTLNCDKVQGESKSTSKYKKKKSIKQFLKTKVKNKKVLGILIIGSVITIYFAKKYFSKDPKDPSSNSNSFNETLKKEYFSKDSQSCSDDTKKDPSSNGNSFNEPKKDDSIEEGKDFKEDSLPSNPLPDSFKDSYPIIGLGSKGFEDFLEEEDKKEVSEISFSSHNQEKSDFLKKFFKGDPLKKGEDFPTSEGLNNDEDASLKKCDISPQRCDENVPLGPSTMEVLNDEENDSLKVNSVSSTAEAQSSPEKKYTQSDVKGSGVKSENSESDSTITEEPVVDQTKEAEKTDVVATKEEPIEVTVVQQNFDAKVEDIASVEVIESGELAQSHSEVKPEGPENNIEVIVSQDFESAQEEPSENSDLKSEVAKSPVEVNQSNEEEREVNEYESSSSPDAKTRSSLGPFTVVTRSASKNVASPERTEVSNDTEPAVVSDKEDESAESKSDVPVSEEGNQSDKEESSSLVQSNEDSDVKLENSESDPIFTQEPVIDQSREDVSSDTDPVVALDKKYESCEAKSDVLVHAEEGNQSDKEESSSLVQSNAASDVKSSSSESNSITIEERESNNSYVSENNAEVIPSGKKEEESIPQDNEEVLESNSSVTPRKDRCLNNSKSPSFLRKVNPHNSFLFSVNAYSNSFVASQSASNKSNETAVVQQNSDTVQEFRGEDEVTNDELLLSPNPSRSEDTSTTQDSDVALDKEDESGEAKSDVLVSDDEGNQSKEEASVSVQRNEGLDVKSENSESDPILNQEPDVASDKEDELKSIVSASDGEVTPKENLSDTSAQSNADSDVASEGNCDQQKLNSETKGESFQSNEESLRLNSEKNDLKISQNGESSEVIHEEIIEGNESDANKKEPAVDQGKDEINDSSVSASDEGKSDNILNQSNSEDSSSDIGLQGSEPAQEEQIQGDNEGAASTQNAENGVQDDRYIANIEQMDTEAESPGPPQRAGEKPNDQGKKKIGFLKPKASSETQDLLSPNRSESSQVNQARGRYSEHTKSSTLKINKTKNAKQGKFDDPGTWKR